VGGKAASEVSDEMEQQSTAVEMIGLKKEVIKD
jgi:hypothetical protein